MRFAKTALLLSLTLTVACPVLPVAGGCGDSADCLHGMCVDRTCQAGEVPSSAAPASSAVSAVSSAVLSATSASGQSSAGSSASLLDTSSSFHPASSLTHQKYTFDDNTVTDSLNGLTWQRVVPTGDYTWAEAKMGCANLILAGNSPWHLPWIEELQSLVDLSTADPGHVINQAAFPNTPQAWFWSASPDINNNFAWAVDFYYGNTSYSPVNSRLRVRCVRWTVDSLPP